MLTLSLRDGVSPALAKMPERLQAALAEKTGALAAELEARVQRNLAGLVLNPRSGALLRSVVATMAGASGNIAVSVATGPDVKYAAIHEFGGVVPPHEIVPDKAKALAFLLGGKQAFAERVNIPAVAMPERSYLRSALGEVADDIREKFSEAVSEATK